MVKEKKIVVFKGGIGDGKDLLIYNFYRKLISFNSHQNKKPRFLLSSLKNNKIFNISGREEMSYPDLIEQYQKDSFQDVIYEVGDENVEINNNNKKESIANKLAKGIYLNDNSTIFFCYFSKGGFSKKIESFADCEVFCKNYHEAIFGKYIILNIELTEARNCCSKAYFSSIIWRFASRLLTGNKIFLRKSSCKSFLPRIVRNSNFKNYF